MRRGKNVLVRSRQPPWQNVFATFSVETQPEVNHLNPVLLLCFRLKTMPLPRQEKQNEVLFETTEVVNI